MGISHLNFRGYERRQWNAGNLVGAKRPLKPRGLRAIDFFLKEHRRMRDRLLFALAINKRWSVEGCQYHTNRENPC
ncbi:MAG: hypothetical protein RLZZ61_887 [Pseudomonadota bacterium]|jgi:hypothetical protein